MIRRFPILLAVLLPSAALAHTSVGSTSGLLYGFEHPLRGVDHILAMVAVGVLAFLLARRALWLVPLAFVGMMVVGFGLGVSGVSLPMVELGIALSSVVIGGTAALGRPLPVGAAMALVGAFALFHGHAHGAEMPSTAGGLAYSAGFVGATALLHALGLALAFGSAVLVGRHGRAMARLAGGGFAIGGLGVVVGWL